MEKIRSYSIPALKRMPMYLRELRRLRQEGRERAASPLLASILGIDTISARKDMEMLGAAGLPGVGYLVDELIDRIEDFLGWKNTSEVFLAGTGELGSALLGSNDFAAHGLRIVAGFSLEPVRPGKTIHDIPVFDLSEFKHMVSRLRIRMAILCVPDDDAQRVATLMADAGIIAVWDFTAAPLQLPEGVICQKVNLAGDLAILSFKLRERLEQNASGLTDRD